MLKIILYQLQSTLSKIEGNTNKIIDFYQKNKNADIIATPEMALSGYSPCDNLFNKDFQNSIKKAIEKIINATKNTSCTLILGTPYFIDNKIYNVALIISSGKLDKVIYKSALPNYGVFNENRYFSSHKNDSNLIDIKGYKISVSICEDIWHKDIVEDLVSERADIFITINASVFETNKHLTRKQIIENNFKNTSSPIIYLNNVGLLDDIIFDGSSFILDKNKNIISFMESFKEDVLEITFENKEISCNKHIEYPTDTLSIIYNALVFATRNFIHSLNAKGVIIGLSGGIDSALSAIISSDALGGENVMAISLPSKYTSNLSKEIINKLVQNANFTFQEISIENFITTSEKELTPFLDLSKNNTLENLQARIRGQIIMAIANNNPKFLPLTTGNKSELATGYCTLYGDTCGAYNIIKDIYKTEVFALAKWRNDNIPKDSKLTKLNVIPKEVITRKPTAELADNQYDEDNLMDYNTLDNILYAIIEKGDSLQELYQKYDKKLVQKVISLIKKSQYKRNQGVLGAKISTRDFTRDFQYMLTDKFLNINDED